MATLVPWTSLNTQTLDALIHEFVTRDGTDYGQREVPTATKTAQVMAHLRAGRCVISYDERSNSVTIIPRENISREG